MKYFFKFLTILFKQLMADLQALRDAIAAEKQQFQDYKTAKEGEITTLNDQLTTANARITELEAQVANPTIPDDVIAETADIVNP